MLHELTHQWFGDLVTMRWFDDLWLKEGFAQYHGVSHAAALQPDDNVWKRFYEADQAGRIRHRSHPRHDADLPGYRRI